MKQLNLQLKRRLLKKKYDFVVTQCKWKFEEILESNSAITTYEYLYDYLKKKKETKNKCQRCNSDFLAYKDIFLTGRNFSKEKPANFSLRKNVKNAKNTTFKNSINLYEEFENSKNFLWNISQR